MNKKTVRIISTIFTIAIVLMCLSSAVFADDFSPSSVTPNSSANGATNVQNVGENILGMIRVVGTIISVGVVMVLGVKYMMGSAEEKASYKKTMIPYLVGAVLLFAASNLAQYIFNFSQSI